MKTKTHPMELIHAFLKENGPSTYPQIQQAIGIRKMGVWLYHMEIFGHIKVSGVYPNPRVFSL